MRRCQLCMLNNPNERRRQHSRRHWSTRSCFRNQASNASADIEYSLSRDTLVVVVLLWSDGDFSSNCSTLAGSCRHFNSGRLTPRPDLHQGLSNGQHTSICSFWYDHRQTHPAQALSLIVAPVLAPAFPPALPAQPLPPLLASSPNTCCVENRPGRNGRQETTSVAHAWDGCQRCRRSACCRNILFLDRCIDRQLMLPLMQCWLSRDGCFS